MLDAYIYDGIRSPFGRHAGALAALRPDELAAQVISALLQMYGPPRCCKVYEPPGLRKCIRPLISQPLLATRP